MTAPGSKADPGRRAHGLEAFPGPVLVLSPHMDDEALACGRLLAALAVAGREIHVLYATDGARSPRVPLDAVADLVRARARETRCAAAELGVPSERLSFLALPDGALACNPAALTRGVARAWDAIRPGCVLFPFRYDRHPDHLALHRAARASARHAPSRAELWEYFVYYRWRLIAGGDVRRLVRPDLIHEPATLAFAGHKRRALDCYQTQTTAWAPGQRRAILPSERVDEVSRAPELFLRPGSRPGSPVLSKERTWVRVVHRIEPALKRVKEAALDAGHAIGRPRSAPVPPRARVGDLPAPSESSAGRPARIVVFASPFPLAAEWGFLARVDAHPGLDLVGVLCRGAGTSERERVADVWRRRRWLAPPILMVEAGRRLLDRAGPDRRTRSRLRRRLRVVQDVHAPEVLRWVESLRPDVGVVYGGPILEPELFGIPKRGTLGVHHGRLPDYRGKKTVFWSMANGERTAGVTIQKINAGLDTGEVVREGAVPIGDRSYRAVSGAVQELGVDLLLDALLAGEPAGGGEARVGGGTLYRDPRAADLARFFLRRLRRS